MNDSWNESSLCSGAYYIVCKRQVGVPYAPPVALPSTRSLYKSGAAHRLLVPYVIEPLCPTATSLLGSHLSVTSRFRLNLIGIIECISIH